MKTTVLHKSIMPLIVLAMTGIQPAYAYLDPGTGSMLLQIILGGLAGLAVAGKLFWHRILALFGIKRPRQDADRDSEPNEPKKA